MWAAKGDNAKSLTSHNKQGHKLGSQEKTKETSSFIQETVFYDTAEDVEIARRILFKTILIKWGTS